MGLPDAARIVLSVALIAPLAFAMGMPFPLGLARVRPRDAPLVPWAWGVNGCASVVGAVLATLLAIHFGFAAVVVPRWLLYGLAAAARPLTLPRSADAGRSSRPRTSAASRFPATPSRRVRSSVESYFAKS